MESKRNVRRKKCKGRAIHKMLQDAFSAIRAVNGFGELTPLICGSNVISEGMTLRDCFAGQVINGLMANSDLEASLRQIENETGKDIEIAKYYSEIAYEIADRMIEERNK